MTEFQEGYKEGYKEAIKECLDIVKFHYNEYDGICWAEREIEELLKNRGVLNED